jgi:hypothetical protein
MELLDPTGVVEATHFLLEHAKRHPDDIGLGHKSGIFVFIVKCHGDLHRLRAEVKSFARVRLNHVRPGIKKFTQYGVTLHNSFYVLKLSGARTRHWRFCPGSVGLYNH